MWRAGLFAGIGGCLWITPADHDQRLDSVRFTIYDLVLAPAGASACTGPDAEIPATIDVGTESDGGRFVVSYAVDGDEPIDAGGLIAADGLLSFVVVIADWTARPGCAAGCELPVTVTVERVGFEATAEQVVDLVPALVPELLDVELASPSGVRAPLEDVAPNGDGAYDVAQWPNLYFGLRDRHFSIGLGGRASLWYCPDDATPDSAPGSCVFAPVEPIPQVVDGEQVFVTPTEFLGQRVCDPSGLIGSWRLFGRLEAHVCGGPYTFPLAVDPVLFVLDDCDHDGSLAGDDCDDLDPAQNPSAIEICDDLDNDCDGTTLTQAVTVKHSDGPPVNYLDLQQALDAALPLDEILVCPGTYPGPFEIRGDATLVGTLGTTVLTGSAGAPVLAVTGLQAPTVVLRGLTVTGGNGVDTGGGIDGRAAGSLTVEDCDIHGNEAIRGGGLAAAPFTTLRRTTIHDNTANQGGGLAIDADCDVSLEATTVEANGAAYGAGIHLDTVVDELRQQSLVSTLTLDATSLVSANVATFQGGGLFAVGDVDLSGGSYVGNDGPSGGAMMLLAARTGPIASAWTVQDVTISGNTGFFGAGILAYGSPPTTLSLSSSTVDSNVAGVVGGGVMLSGATIDALVADLDDVLIEYNEAVLGGGLYLEFVTATVDGGHLKWNVADIGAGIEMLNGHLGVGGTTATDLEFNDAATSAGGIHLDGLALLEYWSGRISANTAVSGGAIGAAGGTAIIGGSIESNVDLAGAAGLLLTGASAARLLPGAVLTGNDGSEVQDSSAIEACAGAVVDDVLGQGGDLDCFTITPAGYVDACGC